MRNCFLWRIEKSEMGSTLGKDVVNIAGMTALSSDFKMNLARVSED